MIKGELDQQFWKGFMAGSAVVCLILLATGQWHPRLTPSWLDWLILAIVLIGGLLRRLLRRKPHVKPL